MGVMATPSDASVHGYCFNASSVLQYVTNAGIVEGTDSSASAG
eukprot:CAMPEP_0179362942 /NCGR_PEP_ID=MMETSP0797-20121207/81270_1 /TAXON_ID=47934 /ORGANISM="Dinophysis acuminata, Strain DAEP01" /LENGTH=42 /DNA_ID= /DNA_START= /DNA_END= /DNA_ORIENTATION=